MELLRNMQISTTMAHFITNRLKRIYRLPTLNYLVTVKIRIHA